VVLDVIEEEQLVQNAEKIGDYISKSLANIQGVTEVRGRGLMIGIELDQPVGPVRDALLFKEHIFCGYAGKSTLRLLPSLAMDQKMADRFLESLENVLKG
jgi:acetylornithine aminotransferase